MIEKNKFIENLVIKYKPQRHWHPLWRTLFWLVLIFIINVFTIALIQPFRGHFLQELIEHKIFFIEVLSIFVFLYSLVFWLFTSMVPGEKLSKSKMLIGGFSFLVFALCLSLGFIVPSPLETYEGARHCVYEIIIYGSIGLISFCYFLRKMDFVLSTNRYFFMGLVSALVPGILMQIACMYTPMHALKWHYGPVLIIGSLGLLFNIVKFKLPS